MMALSGEELLAWVERTATGWRHLIAEHPEVLGFPCDVRETSSVAELIRHIVAVELRYVQRLLGLPESPYHDVPLGSGEELYATHDQAMTLMRELLSHGEIEWEEQIDFQTRSSGRVRVSRRVVLVHLFTHSIRHYAQLATLVRQHGVKPDWPMDYLYMGTEV